MTETESVSQLLRRITQRLADAGLDSAHSEARIVVSHVLQPDNDAGSNAIWNRTDHVTAPQSQHATELASARAQTRAPLQYLVGKAVTGHLDLEVGPGVFIPRPETELLVVDVLDHLGAADRDAAAPIVVDLCAGSGTLALEIAHARPDARVYAVEKYDEALYWLNRNSAARRAAGDTPITTIQADVAAGGVLAELDGQVTIVVSNPPYIPEGTPLPKEVADFEPHSALFGGSDGLQVIRPIVTLSTRLLIPGGRLIIEHDDATSGDVAALLESSGNFGTVERHTDLAGRPRYVTAIRQPAWPNTVRSDGDHHL